MSLLMAIHQKAEAERLRSLLVDTICLLVKNGTTHVKQSITIEGVIGCTIDKGLDNEHVGIVFIWSLAKWPVNVTDMLGCRYCGKFEDTPVSQT